MIHESDSGSSYNFQPTKKSGSGSAKKAGAGQLRLRLWLRLRNTGFYSMFSSQRYYNNLYVYSNILYVHSKKEMNELQTIISGSVLSDYSFRLRIILSGTYQRNLWISSLLYVEIDNTLYLSFSDILALFSCIFFINKLTKRFLYTFYFRY